MRNVTANHNTGTVTRGVNRFEGLSFSGRLPRSWWSGLEIDTVARVLEIESASDAGTFYLSGLDAKGYRWVKLCAGHPYATRGWQRLHRYLMMRAVGRRLASHEHVHHVKGADKATVSIRELKLMDAIEHAFDHWRERCRCANVLWSPRDVLGRFTAMPTEVEIEKARQEY